MFERSAWWSEFFWPEPGVVMISTSSPSSRKNPSSRATSSGRSWIAFIIETRTFFSAFAMAYSPSLGTHSILGRAEKHTSGHAGPQSGHHFSHEQIQRMHRLLGPQVPEGEDEQQIIDSRFAHHLGELPSDRPRRAGHQADRKSVV